MPLIGLLLIAVTIIGSLYFLFLWQPPEHDD